MLSREAFTFSGQEHDFVNKAAEPLGESLFDPGDLNLKAAMFVKCFNASSTEWSGLFRDLTMIRADEPDIVQINSVDVSNAPPTPTCHPDQNTAKLAEYDLCHLAITTAFGRSPFTLADVSNGLMVMDIFPDPQYWTDNKNGRSAGVQLVWHADYTLTFEERPEYLSLLAIRNSENVPTRVSYVNKNDLSVNTMDEFQESIWLRRIIDRTYPDGRLLLSAIVPKDIFTSKFPPYEQRALLEVQDAFDRNMEEICLSEGEVLLWNNHRLVHSRDKYEPNPNPENRRWMRRLYLRTNDE